MNLQHKSGAMAEMFVATEIMKRDWNVLFPFATQSRYDFIMEADGVCYKVQVKKASWSKTGPYKYLQARISGKNGMAYTPYTPHDVDYFAFTDMNRVWLFPYDEIGHQTSVCLDSTNPNYKPQTSYVAADWLM